MDRNNSHQTTLRFSRWVKQFERGDAVALLHSILLNLVFVSKDIFRKTSLPRRKDILVREIGGQTVEVLLKEGMLVPTDNRDMDLLEKERKKLKEENTLDMMYLLLSDGCNLRCKYCFEDTPETKGFKAMCMKKEVVEAAISLFARSTEKYGNPNKDKLIQLYGGEPLLNPAGVRAAVASVNDLRREGKLPENSRIVTITNGTLLTEEMAQFFKENSVSVGISIDGPKTINDFYRVSRGGDSVHDGAIRAYKMLKGKGVETGLSVTLTPKSVDVFDEVLEYLVEDIKVQDGLSFNILHHSWNVPADQAYFAKAACCIIKGFEKFRQIGVYEERMMRKVKALINKKPIFADCGVVGNQIVIAPDGQVGSCQDFVKPRSYFQGSALDSNYDPWKEGLFGGWEERSPFYMSQCFDCEALGICGGGCPASVELSTGSRWNVDERTCPHSKLSLEWMIWEVQKGL